MTNVKVGFNMSIAGRPEGGNNKQSTGVSGFFYKKIRSGINNYSLLWSLTQSSPM